MINAWSLLYEELNGTMDKTYPIENTELNGDKIEINTGTGNTIYNVPDSPLDDITFPSGSNDDTITITGGENTIYDFENSDAVNFDLGVGSTACAYQGFGVDTLDLDFSGCYGSSTDVLTFVDPNDPTAKIAPPGIESNNPRKYKEDESIKALQDYISTTYGGHYTSKENNVQTLDLIESVGDAESFCRSNAIKYLSRYDKKGQAKRDILKALHYTLLLYHFSGQLKETTTRGYETF